MHRSVLITCRCRAGLKASPPPIYIVTQAVTLDQARSSPTTLLLSKYMELAVNASLSKAVVTDASEDVEKSQLAAIRGEMAMFESSGKRGRGLSRVGIRIDYAKYPAVISQRRKSVLRR